MTPLRYFHDRYVFPRRVERLAQLLAGALPPGATSLLDVGAGDGSVAARVRELRPGVGVTGVDVLVRPVTRIPVVAYDGETLPFNDGTFDAVCFVDVLHHTDDPIRLLHEAGRVARHVVLVKDHVADSPLARPTLRAMDWSGNARHGVRLPYNYLSTAQWHRAAHDAGLRLSSWDQRLRLYPQPLSLLLDRRLHVFASLTTDRQVTEAGLVSPASSDTGSQGER